MNDRPDFFRLVSKIPFNKANERNMCFDQMTVNQPAPNIIIIIV